MENCNTCVHNKVCTFRNDRIKLDYDISGICNKFPDVFTIEIKCNFYKSESTVRFTPDTTLLETRKLYTDEHIGDPNYIQIDWTNVKPPRY